MFAGALAAVLIGTTLAPAAQLAAQPDTPVGDDIHVTWVTPNARDLKDPTTTYTQHVHCTDTLPSGQNVLYPYLVREGASVAYRNLSTDGVTVTNYSPGTDVFKGDLALSVTSLHLHGNYAFRASVACSANNPDGYVSVVANGVTDLTPTTATLQGTVTSNHLSSDVVVYWAEYGQAFAVYPGNSGPQNFNTDKSTAQQQHTIAVPLTGLQPGTTYHYRLAARHNLAIEPGDDNKSYSGPDMTFSTPLS